MRLWPIIAVVLALAVGTQADFAAQTGFSGRVADCSQCHPAPLTDNDAVAILEGLPETWMPGETYPLRVAVEGGPPAAPDPQPKGGFEIEASVGSFAGAPGTDGLFRSDRPERMTYEPPGTLMRQWDIEWTAPGLGARPAPVGFWLAVVSANGNHVIATNTSDLGEHGDATDAIHITVQPDPEAEAAWIALPLSPPRIDGGIDLVAKTGTLGTIQGRQTDGNATVLAYRYDDAPWQSRDATGAWRLQVPFEAGVHTLTLRSEGADRVSPPVTLTLEGRSDGPETPQVANEEAPLPVILMLAALVGAAWTRR